MKTIGKEEWEVKNDVGKQLLQYLAKAVSALYAAFRCARTYSVSRETFMLNPLMAGFLLGQPHCGFPVWQTSGIMVFAALVNKAASYQHYPHFCTSLMWITCNLWGKRDQDERFSSIGKRLSAR